MRPHISPHTRTCAFTRTQVTVVEGYSYSTSKRAAPKRIKEGRRSKDGECGLDDIQEQKILNCTCAKVRTRTHLIIRSRPQTHAGTRSCSYTNTRKHAQTRALAPNVHTLTLRSPAPKRQVGGPLPTKIQNQARRGREP